MLRRILLVGAVVAAAALSLTGAAGAASLGGFGARPAHFDPAVPATRSYFIRRLAPGARFSDQVIIFNDAAKPLAVSVYPVDGLTGATSGVVYGNRQTPLVGAGRWLSLPTSHLTIPAHAQRRLSFTVTAPSSAAPGQHLAGIAIQQAHPQRSGGRFSVTEVLRTVVGVELDVPGPTHARLAVRAIAPAKPGQSAASGLIISVANEGQRLCKPRLAITLTGRGRSQHIVRQLDVILPGGTIPYPVTVSRALNRGTYSAGVTATRCGRPATLHQALIIGHRISPPHDPTGATQASAPAAAVNWWLIALIGGGGVAAGALGAGVLLARGRRRLRPQP
jgi:hypothetical protein